MTDVLFYHLERASLEDVLPGLLEKTLERDWRAVVRASSAAMVEKLDAYLWTYREESFLPHGSGAAKSDSASAQPVWLTSGDDLPNAPHLLFLVDNATADISALAPFERCVMIFDGRDEDAVADARAFWKGASAAGHEATYWKQSPQGRWEKQG